MKIKVVVEFDVPEKDTSYYAIQRRVEDAIAETVASFFTTKELIQMRVTAEGYIDGKNSFNSRY